MSPLLTHVVDRMSRATTTDIVIAAIGLTATLVLLRAVYRNRLGRGADDAWGLSNDGD